eukprot:TRINITY_DN18664_c0_g1_i1.p1 TRINITY_DN18664_c0_g1~~TRINITY_DN18664_c0_g1_i1.p1  ORF type:complete len:401 (-),score=69.82 TRINITY_DN18664_c0_g1_i1:259-1461(-)
MASVQVRPAPTPAIDLDDDLSTSVLPTIAPRLPQPMLARLVSSDTELENALKVVIDQKPPGVANVIKRHRVESTLVFASLFMAACFALGLTLAMESDRLGRDYDNARFDARPYAESLRAQLEKSIGQTISLAAVLGVEEQMANKTAEHFVPIADTMIKRTKGITNMQLAPCGIVSQIHPIAGSEAAIGHNLIKDADRAADAVRTIENRQVTFVGPLNLIQGGFAIIGRFPVFVPLGPGSNSSRCAYNFYGVSVPSDFWGFATILTMIPDLLRPVGFEDLGRLKGLHYQLVAPWGGKTVLVDGYNGEDIEEFAEEAVNIDIRFEQDDNMYFATWSLRVKPKDGWVQLSDLGFAKIIFFVVSSVLGLVTRYYMLSARGHMTFVQTQLRNLVHTSDEKQAAQP